MSQSEALGLSMRTVNALVWSDIETADQLLGLTPDDIQSLKGIGVRGSVEIKRAQEWVKEHGIAGNEPILLDLYKAGDSLRNHQHKFVMPVEWMEWGRIDVHQADSTYRKAVTKLRCECGEEIDR